MTYRHIENIFNERYVFDSTTLMYLYGDCARQVERTRSGVQELVPSVNFAPPPPQRGLPCKHCHETFANEQGRGIHTRTTHPTANMCQGVRLQRMLGKEDAGRDVLPWDRAGPGRCWHVECDCTTEACSFTLQRKRFRTVDLESDGFTTDNPKATRGAVKRTRYDHRTKAHAVNQLRILQESEKELWDAEHLTPLQYLETFLKICQSLISKWAKEEDKLVKLTALEVTKTLLATQQPKRWFPEAESKLYGLFFARGKKKLKVSTLWLMVTYRKLLQEMYPTDKRAAAFCPSFRWMQKWAKAHLLSKRRRSNSKNKSVEERLPAIQRFHRKFRKLLKQPVRRRGAVFTEDRPLEMAVARPAEETRLEKYRDPFMQVIFGPGSRLMRISVIFRDTGKRISPVEKAAYHKNVDVFFQENAWADQKFCMEWAQRSYRKRLMRGRSHYPKRGQFFSWTTCTRRRRMRSRSFFRSIATRMKCSPLMQGWDAC